MTSLRTQLWVWLLALLTGVGLFVGATSYWIVRDESDGFFDQELRQIALNVGQGAPSIAPLAADTTPHDPEDDFAVQIWTSNGPPVKQSPLAAQIARGSVTGFSDHNTDAGGWRTFTLVGTASTVQVSQQRAVRDELASDAVWRSLQSIVVIVPLSWLLLSFVINTVLRRLDILAKSLALRNLNDREPIPVAGLPSEIAPLVLAMNDLLQRLQEALAAQKRFVADAAHELRTPLAALQLQIGNLRAVATGSGAATRIDELERGVRRATQLTRQLLRLARYNEAEIKSQAAPVDLAEVTRAAIAELLPLADHRGQDLGLVRSDQAMVIGDADDLRVLIGNLLENACRYSPEAGIIDVAIVNAGGEVTVDVRDTGPGIPVDQLGLVFEAFHRGTDAGTEGSGLGLSIVARIAERHGARVTLANRTDGPGLSARVVLQCHTAVTAS